MMKDGELSARHMELGNFAIRIHRREHKSWQGFVTHLEKNETVPFRSALELLLIINNILNEEEQEAGILK